MQNSGILLIFHKPEIPGLKRRQSRDSGSRDWNSIAATSDGRPSAYGRHGVRWGYQWLPTDRITKPLGVCYGFAAVFNLVESRRRWRWRCVLNSQLHDDCRRMRSTVWKLTQFTIPNHYLVSNDVIIPSLVTNLNSLTVIGSTAQEIVNWVTTVNGSVHTADADATQLDSWVASRRRRRCIVYLAERTNVYSRDQKTSRRCCLFAGKHRRRSSVNFGGEDILPENYVWKIIKMPEFLWYLPEKFGVIIFHTSVTLYFIFLKYYLD